MQNATPANVDEAISVKGTSTWGKSVVGSSGMQKWNLSTLDQIGRGNWGRSGPKDARGARRFRSAVDLAGERLYGKRTPFSCAEVNAVTKLLNCGVELDTISLGQPYGSDQRPVHICDSCKKWSEALGIPIG
ncbi:MAG: hypothetical protein HC834_06135 [Rhodospirillales bacterium]|nr:hypothetical protein [Rhodospirillales bacterium]